ncbi:MAG TPA: IS110 family transposase [Anaerolineales bacterium]|nr:IS110 family transposase [Anaerolineales bacterium]
MVPKTTRQTNNTTKTGKLYLALELSQAEWKLGFTIGLGQAPRLRSIKARKVDGLQREIEQAKVRFGLPKETEVCSCYEAGRDGFWLHRYLEANGVSNAVVDSASIEVNRRFRRVKTDRLDVGKLLNMLIRYHQGEPKVWSVVHVPSRAEEDQRQLHRELLALKREQTHHINRMKGVLASQGVELEVKTDFLEQLDAVRLWDGSSIPPGLQALLVREYERLQFVRAQMHQIEEVRKEILSTSPEPAIEQVRRLLRLKGIGINSAWVYVMEFFAWRAFRNRRELGSLSGLTPTPYESGESSRERGISKAGNRPVRAMAIEIAWSWLRNQPDSQLSCWYRQRFAKGGSRVRRIGIVALARKLLIALWRYLEYGLLPEGAQLKPT